MITTLIFSDQEKTQKLQQWGWVSKEVIEEETYQNVTIDHFKTTMWHQGDEKLLLDLDNAFAQELSTRILKLV